MTAEELAAQIGGGAALAAADPVAELTERVQALELQQDEEAQISAESRRIANQMTAERVKEITWLRRTRVIATAGAALVVAGFMASFGYALLWKGGTIIAALHDPWVKLAFITGHLVLIGLVVTIMLKALYTPTAKDESNATLLEAFKTVVNAARE